MTIAERALGADILDTALASRWWAVGIRGVLAVVFALVAFSAPGVTMLSLVWVFAAYAFIDGVVALWAAASGSGAGAPWWLLVLEGLVSILAAALAVTWPSLTVVAFVTLIGIWAIVSGVLMVAAAFSVHVGRWWLVLGGIVSVIYGVLLFAAPTTGALVLTWWIGAYALIFGAAMIMLAFELHGRKR